MDTHRIFLAAAVMVFAIGCPAFQTTTTANRARTGLPFERAGSTLRSSLPGGAYPANSGAPRGARSVAATASGAGYGKALSAFRVDVGRFPTAAEGLTALLRQPAGVRNWRGPYVAVTNPARPFADPWGNDYRLVITPLPGSPGSTASIKSNGPDGLPDTADDLSVNF